MVRVDVGTHNTLILVALIALTILAAIAWTRDPSCPECPHCRAEKDRKKRENAELARRFWNLPPDDDKKAKAVSGDVADHVLPAARAKARVGRST